MMDVNQYATLTFLSTLLYIGFVIGDIIGDTCRYDNECFVEQSFCHKQEVCQCKHNFAPSEDLHYCVAMIGAICNSKHDCATLPNSMCYEENCICERGFVPDPHHFSCKPVSSGLKGDCEHDAQCQTVIGDFATCAHGRCECLPNYHYHGKCVRSRSLGDSCLDNVECYSKHQLRNVTVCKGGYCRCRQGYRQTTDGHCTSSGALNIGHRMLFIIFIAILTLF